MANEKLNAQNLSWLEDSAVTCYKIMRIQLLFVIFLKKKKIVKKMCHNSNLGDFPV